MSIILELLKSGWSSLIDYLEGTKIGVCVFRKNTFARAPFCGAFSAESCRAFEIRITRLRDLAKQYSEKSHYIAAFERGQSPVDSSESQLSIEAGHAMTVYPRYPQSGLKR